MTFRLQEMRQILGARLAQLWLSDGAQSRAVTCVTCIERMEDITDAQSGEVMILMGSASPEHCALEILERGTAGSPAALLVSPLSLSEQEQRRVRELALNGQIGVGLLASDVDPRDTINVLSRAVASPLGSIDAARLHTAQTLQSLAETLGRLIGNSVTIESPGHEVLASSPTGSDVDQHRVDTILRRRAGAKFMEREDFKIFLSRVRASDWPLHLEAHPEFGHSGRIAMRVTADGELYGIIWVTDTARPLNDQDYAAIRQAAEAAAAILVRGHLATRREAMLRAELLEDVIRGRISEPENVRTVALSVGWNVDRLQQALIVAIDNFETLRLRGAGRSGAAWRWEQERLMELVKLEVLAIDPEAVVGMRSSSVVILLDVGQEPGSERKAAATRLADSIVRRAAAFLHETRVTVGVGRDFPSFEHMAESFRQAELAAELGQTLWGGNRALHYDDLGIHRVLFALREHEGMVPPALQRIIAHDQEHGTEYVLTLAAYLRHMGRLRLAAEELGIHRNTLEYRVGRIAQLAEMDLDNADNRLALELGVRLLELDGSPRRGASPRPGDAVQR
jgi:sugar diacid utilization regulator